MAEELILNVITQEGGKEIVDQLKALIAGKTTMEAVVAKLAEYSNTEAVNALISAAIEASEKKIFGEGELAEAFDTIQEIGAYLKDHDDVADAINEAIAKKLDKETYDSDQNTLKGRVGQNETDIAGLKEALGISDDPDTPGADEKGSFADRLEEVEEELDNKLDKSTYEADKAGFETKQNAEATYQKKSDMEDYETAEEAEAKYVQIANLKAVPVATIQSWFE